jgi:hypothetical protein
MKQRVRDTFEDLQDEQVKQLVVDEDNVFVQLQTADSANFLQFYAHRYGRTDGSVSFSIRTTDAETGRRHPYFEQHRPSKLARPAIDHFEQSTPIRALNFTWTRVYGPPDGPSDNYTTYLSTINRLRGTTSPANAQRQAILATWTVQRIAIPNGFLRLGEVHEEVRNEDTVDSPTEIHGTMWR